MRGTSGKAGFVWERSLFFLVFVVDCAQRKECPNMKTLQLRQWPALGGKVLAFLCAVLVPAFAHAAPDCIVTVEGKSINVGPFLDAEHGYCLTQQLVIDGKSGGWITHTVYEDGASVDGAISVEAQKNVRFEATESGKTRYVSYGADSWRQDEYTRYLPTPPMPAFSLGVIHGKAQEAGEWFLSALFVDKEGKAIHNMRAYVDQLKAGGFTVDADERGLPGKDGARPLPAALLTYGAKNQAGFLVKVLCTGPQLCHLSLDNPAKAKHNAVKNAARKAKQEEARRSRKKFDDDFADLVNSLPDE
jgi:hypothetical protein